MIKSICFKCGAGKEDPMSCCTSCGTRPVSDAEQVTSIYLSSQLLSAAELGQVSRTIRSGQRISVPSGLQSQAAEFLRQMRRDAQQAQARRVRRKRFALAAMAVVLLLFLFLGLHSWPRYAWARLRNSENAYSSFTERFPNSTWTENAKRHLLELREPARWASASGTGDLGLLRAYLSDYPDSPHGAAARTEIGELAQDRWWAVQNSSLPEEVQRFIADFPDHDLATPAKGVLAELRRYQDFKDILKTGNSKLVGQYIRNNPNSKYLAEAKAELEKLAQKRWLALSASESESELRAFKRDFAETQWAQEAEKRIAALYGDLQWLTKMNSLAAYRRHLDLYPNSPYRSEVNDRMIRLEAAQIAADSSGVLPPATRLSLPSSGYVMAEVGIANETGYELTVWYTGFVARKVVLPVGCSQTIQLSPGAYTVAASVTAPHVRNYSGTDTLEAASYSMSFTIRSERFPVFLPTPGLRR